MKKTYKLEELGCANCAAKMERKIGELNGVNECRISFMTGKMILDLEDGQESEIMKEAKKIIKKLEPDVGICEI